MAKRPALFKQTDLTRAVKAVREAGEAVGGVEIMPDGRIRVLVGTKATPAETELDAWMKRQDRHAG